MVDGSLSLEPEQPARECEVAQLAAPHLVKVRGLGLGLGLGLG